jgi:hypothetical protein
MIRAITPPPMYIRSLLSVPRRLPIGNRNATLPRLCLTFSVEPRVPNGPALITADEPVNSVRNELSTAFNARTRLVTYAAPLVVLVAMLGPPLPRPLAMAAPAP